MGDGIWISVADQHYESQTTLVRLLANRCPNLLGRSSIGYEGKGMALARAMRQPGTHCIEVVRRTDDDGIGAGG